MSEVFGFSDLPAITRATWEIYSQCQQVAKDAPDGFRKLAKELGSLQGAMRAMTDDYASNTAFFGTLAEDRRLMLERCLHACLETLSRLTDLLNHYRELGISDGRHFWQRIKWSTQQMQIEDIRSKLMVHTCNMSLCMSPIENSSLLEIERKMTEAMQEDEEILIALETSRRDSVLMVSPLSVESGLTNEFEDAFSPAMSRPTLPRTSSRGSKSSQQIGYQSPGRPRHASSSSASVMSGSDSSLYGGPAPSYYPHTSRSYSQSLTGEVHVSRTLSPPPLYEKSVDSLATDKIAWDEDSDNQDKQSIGKSSNSSSTEFGDNNVIEAVNSAMYQLREVRLQEQLARPIRFEPQNKVHKPDEDTIKIFESSINEERQIRRLITSDWLRVATWWLLKARATLANCSRHSLVSARGGISMPADSRSVTQQAYVDLLKASRAFTDYLDRRKSKSDFGSLGINEELSQYTPLDNPEPSILRAQILDIWEPIQSEETSESGLDLSFGLHTARWIAVNQEDAGSEEERVLYRTFVNAGIGTKKFRMRTRGAPYMFLLTAKDGEIIPDDLPPLINLINSTRTGFPGAQISEPISFKFDNTSVSISFQFEADLAHFINIPKLYFDSVWSREPIDSKEFTETVIFKGSVQTFEQLKTPTMKAMNPPMLIKSCDVRILERSFGETWRCIRRIVISPSVAERSPRCLEFFMPLSRVQVKREELSRQVLLKWSDTCQERSDKTDGNYNTLHSYVYDHSAPNIGIGLQFSTQQNAEDFERALMEINFKSSFSWSEPSGSSGRIYDVVDTGTEHKQYKAAVLIQNSGPWRYSDVFYLYRDTDYSYQHSSLRVRFPHASYADYISSHSDQLYVADKPVVFSHTEKKTKAAMFKFDSDSIARAFMSSLSPSYDLVYSRRIHSLSIKTNMLGSKRSGKGDAEIQLWQRGNTTQLAARWNDSVPDKWLTMSLPGDFSDSPKDNLRVSFAKLPYFRGVSLDLMNIMARSPKTTSVINREGAISISFKRVKGSYVTMSFLVFFC
ncbi:hypothetical protein N7478_010334 [Penicillium angulare]|uniref:uncharacterized protein n=1 Tax=Penicillium angulare TaxID=116970 RepID=UPI002542265B|nr:uncharacterized protein N7478_010334 [Penicillium angulare]KAJ5267526.1 hypothetical protein N7478_010334 [Penicillium angulare]